MLHLVNIIRTDVSEEGIAPIIRVTRIGELGTTLAVTSHRNTFANRYAIPWGKLRSVGAGVGCLLENLIYD
jgi:hypothetical protein